MIEKKNVKIKGVVERDRITGLFKFAGTSELNESSWCGRWLNPYLPQAFGKVMEAQEAKDVFGIEINSTDIQEIESDWIGLIEDGKILALGPSSNKLYFLNTADVINKIEKGVSLEIAQGLCSEFH